MVALSAWQVYRSHALKSFTPTSTSIMVENFITHNGDLDFFRVGSKFHDLHTVQLWLEQATGFPMPATVDSAAIAGLVDLIRTAGSFGLSARFSFLLGLKTSTIELARSLPSRQEYHLVGQVFDRSLLAFCKTKSVSILDISNSVSLRAELAAHTTPFIQSHIKSNPQSSIFVDNFDEENGTMTTSQFVAATINAFFDNDLFQTTKYFLENARGSFGLMFTSSLDASSQICIAARGQTMSVALYPRKGVILRRLQARVDEKVAIHAGSVDILLTGCEVSLWLAEQFATDLQKAFPKLFVKVVSSNKLLGVFGQELSIPCTGYPLSQDMNDFSDAIILIVSHSGGTFAPLACSNLLQAKTQNIFVVTSEWDTQIGKQLRGMTGDMLSSRIFTTQVGVRPAEPCSISVAATHQLLTQLFQQTALSILSDSECRRITGAVITETDIKILERCNRDNIRALESITGCGKNGEHLLAEFAHPETLLREAGRQWSDHILENARALIMTFVYIVATVTAGYPLITGLSIACGLNSGSAFYATRFLDSLLYFFLPQINVTILRLVQGRNLRHRMVGRTVVIGDIPWVSQAADAFLSKIFACSYSVAGLNVLSGNPADHLVHRHTHRVVRGSLLVCGRPDGRLMSLTSAEATVCLSINQASSIQSIGGTCESVTIGHNPSTMALTKNDIFLETHRPKFLCERLLLDENFKAINSSKVLSADPHESDAEDEPSTLAHYLLGVYMGWAHDAQRQLQTNKSGLRQSGSKSHYEKVVESMIQEKSENKRLKTIFDAIDVDGSGTLDIDEFTSAYKMYDSSLTDGGIHALFKNIDTDGSGYIDFKEFAMCATLPKSQMLKFLQVVDRKFTAKNLDPEASTESYFGAALRETAPEGTPLFSLCESQNLSMELYESRIASMQRFVAMTVMFHEMGRRVQQFFPRVSFGYLGYRMDRTHSIMRIATTASPVSGSDVRERMDTIKLKNSIKKAVNVISSTWYIYRQKESRRLLREKSMGMIVNVAKQECALTVE
ncbi:hypothetical protein MHU86_19467 [Fragilaria crotonensis]|nr:hypothetical protein MHU86_19467 [Fragilaria crotonensis]